MFFLAEEAEALLLFLLLVLLPLAGARAGLRSEGDGGGQGLGSARRWGALVAGSDLYLFQRPCIQDGLDPCTHLLLSRGSQRGQGEQFSLPLSQEIGVTTVCV